MIVWLLAWYINGLALIVLDAYIEDVQILREWKLILVLSIFGPLNLFMLIWTICSIIQENKKREKED